MINDDLVEPNTGFGMHPHRDMEIISYVVNGELMHGDNMGNKNAITRGHIQYMSAGTGVFHSEQNAGHDTLRFLQIWILPDKYGQKPNYGDYRFKWEDRKNNWLHMVSGKMGAAPICINQDANIYSLELEKGKEMSFPVLKGRQAYLVQIEGSSIINFIQQKSPTSISGGMNAHWYSNSVVCKPLLNKVKASGVDMRFSEVVFRASSKKSGRKYAKAHLI